MAKCPKCGTETWNPIKTWSLTGKPNKLGERFRLTVGMFKCANCGATFRDVVDKEKISIKGMVTKIKVIQGEFTQVLRNLREKIKKLETEKASLLAEIEELKKAAEAKAGKLESEVSKLRGEVKSLKELLGRSETK